ncbi:MAG: hypothetical protein M3203_03670 [Actinomycetota bacterium]|nr:hypothetical protein [Actinomycetota bacterium]
MTTVGPSLVPVRLQGLPLDVYRRASEHTDELLREFMLIGGDNSEQVPARLVALMEELSSRFAGFTEGQRTAMQEALARGDTEIDLLYEVPPEAADAAVRLGALLDEADDFCRAGDLLTLATPPEGVAFRRWFLEEFVLQIRGHAPRSWARFLESEADG